MTRLRGKKSLAPCWWCSRQLYGFHGWPALVDGNEVVFHGPCLNEALEDEDVGRRVEPLPPFQPRPQLQ